MFDEKTWPSISLQKNITPNSSDLRCIFPYISSDPKESTTTSPNEPTAVQEKKTVTEEELEPLSEHPEAQTSRIRIIGPRHPTLISSKIDSANILFFQRRPRTNLTQIRTDDAPKSYKKALSGTDKEK
ncbi:hypothetical protein O181_117504 [Austropuccinia psidii MF-1]|uniref:Uncharacterized protein n=1 Tax=Austropuccinia psidii MF-1 TaxID=1389203 RepID=A0A9Q3PXK1_9BASI|nr:hypothetical protein [Austropuccinia psidii MF-1]